MTVTSNDHEAVLSSAGSDTTAIASSRERERDEKDKAPPDGREFEADRKDGAGGKQELDLEEGELQKDKEVVKKPW